MAAAYGPSPGTSSKHASVMRPCPPGARSWLAARMGRMRPRRTRAPGGERAKKQGGSIGLDKTLPPGKG